MTLKPIIIPEINDPHSMCDYLNQSAAILSQKNFPTFIFYLNNPPKLANPLAKLAPNLYSFTPVKIFPFNRFRLSQNINIFLSFNFLYLYCFIKYHSRPIYWIFYPQVAPLLQKSFPPKILIHDIIDFFTSPDPKTNKSLQSHKKYLLKKSNLVTSISHSFKKNYLQIYPKTTIHLLPQGFKLIQSTKNIHPQIKSLRLLKNRVGFIGAINNRLDFKLLFKLIPSTPKINYIFVGPTIPDINVSPKNLDILIPKLLSFSNFHHISQIPKDQISQFIKLFDIATIPYDTNDDFNRLCCPMKLFEYFVAGKPVLATKIEELKYFSPYTITSNNHLVWKKQIQKLLSKPWPKKYQQHQQTLANKNTWANKLEQIFKLLEKSKLL